MIYVVLLGAVVLPLALGWWLARAGRAIWSLLPALALAGYGLWALVQARAASGWDAMGYEILIGVIVVPGLIGLVAGLLLGLYRRRQSGQNTRHE